ncbi:NAD(P)/FAD-dependent oxidoreductase [Paracoccus homiensis]|uniref:Glycine/D-amino acid oxidase n=1 Tax=Paracoccus homiensis TaxID=364199 RepID=A0A1I0JEP0_9RHOB|nr:FAD-binding oxidoreductase [Paracoccus homiensis]SEU08598.1 Glycine/D-amino acid oxidase [Paracoccus homiensis]
MVEQVQAIVIGGGIVGCSILYGLAERGMTDTLLLEKNELTSGSTWHAAGNCTHFGHDAEITRLYVNSIRTYLRAQEESGQSVGFHKTGSLRLATTPDELASYERLVPIYKKLGIPYQVVSPQQIPALHPLMNCEGVLGAAHTPDDGHVDPTGATMAMAQSARARGARILQQHPADSIRRSATGVWEVRSNDKVFTTTRLIVATSFWAREMLAQLDIDVPLYALEHHELVTETHPDIAALGFELPTVRDPYVSGNVRQEGKGFLIGVYEKEPVAWNVDGIPPEFGRELLVPDLERLMPNLERCMWRFPAFAQVGIKVANNGPLCYAPDGFPMLGPVPGQEGLWLASGFHVGIGTGGGAGQFLSEWIATGKPPYRLACVDPARFAAPMDTQTAVSSILGHYAAGYATPPMDVAI